MCTTDYMESDEDQGGTISINVKDSMGDLEETNAADNRKGDKDRSARQQIRNDTEVFAQNSVEDRGVIKKTTCMELSVEGSIIHAGDSLVVNLNEKMTKAKHVACKEPCNTNVANGSNGSQEEVASLPPNHTGQGVLSSVSDPPNPKHGYNVIHEVPQALNEETTKVLGKVRTWRRKIKDNTAGSTYETEGKRKFEDVGWMSFDIQETQTKKCKSRGEVPSQLAKAVAVPVIMSLMLELSRAWEASNSSRSAPNGARKETQFCLSYRNSE
jgi:hypothetical protein